jgi:hypothetical protein
MAAINVNPQRRTTEGLLICTQLRSGKGSEYGAQPSQQEASSLALLIALITASEKV